MHLQRWTTLAVALLFFAVTASCRADLTSGMKRGTPEIKSISTLTFGPEGILFVGDSQAASVFAIATGDKGKNTEAPASTLKVENLNEKVASLLGIEAKQLLIKDLAVNPASSTPYLAVTRGTGPDATPVILTVNPSTGKLAEFSLKDVPFSQVSLPNAAEGRNRLVTITCLAFVKDRLFAAGLSNEDFASTLRSIPFPFKDAERGAGIEIFHGAHGKLETNSPVQTFTPFDIKGEAHLLAAYTCTPLVKIPVNDLKAGARVKGTTVAELGNRNKPLDMVVYEKGGKQFVLMSNSARGVMKISTEGIDSIQPITERVGGGGTAGLKYETISTLKGVQQLARLNDTHALVLVRAETGEMTLNTIDLP